MQLERVVEILDGAEFAMLRGSRGVYLVETKAKELYLVHQEGNDPIEILPVRLSGPEALLPFQRWPLDTAEVSHYN